MTLSSVLKNTAKEWWAQAELAATRASTKNMRRIVILFKGPVGGREHIPDPGRRATKTESGFHFLHTGGPVTTPPRQRGATARNLELLRCIASGPAEFTLKSLAERAQLPASTVHRLIGTWVQRDLLEHTGPKSYRLGPELFRLAGLIQQRFEVQRLARPLLTTLWKDWQETAVFCLFSPSTRAATVVESLPSPHPLKYELPLNSLICLSWGSLGRAILAHLPPPEIEAELSTAVPGPLSRTPLPPRKTMLRELALIRGRRYALYHEPTVNIAGISAAVLHPDGRVLGSLGVILPATRLTRTVQSRLPPAVVESARRLGTQLVS